MVLKFRSRMGKFSLPCLHSLRFLNNYQVVEHGLGHLPFTEKQVITPTGKLTFISASY